MRACFFGARFCASDDPSQPLREQSQKESEPMKPSHLNQIGPRHTFSGVLVLILALGFCLPACSQTAKAGDKKPTAGGNQVLATVDGKPITESDVKTQAADQFAQLEREFETNQHQLLENQLDQTIQDR